MRPTPILLFAASVWLAFAAAAADKTLADFFGAWVGSGVAKDGGKPTQTRDGEVEIARFQDGFKISWTTMRSQIGNPAASVVKGTSLTFRGGETPGVYFSVDATDPFAGDGAAWAQIRGATLTIQILRVDEKGALNLQVYDRTLTAPGAMDVAFKRITDGRIVRQASLKLVKAP
jgi:uncharacterized protein YcbX